MKRLHLLAFTDEEIELLYDALDAVNDRYEQYHNDYAGTFELANPAEEELTAARAGLLRTTADLERTKKLTEEFQPLIKEIRRESTRSDSTSDESPARCRGPDRGPDRKRPIPSR